MFDIFSVKDPQKALEKAHEFIREGRADSAIKVLEDNLTETAESFDLYQELARLYYKNEQRQRAVELLRQIQSIIPSRTDEIIAELSELFYRHTSIDSGDLLIQLYVDRQKYDEIEKILNVLNEREVRLLLTKYDKLAHSIDNKNVLTKHDFSNILITSSIRFFLNEGETAAQIIEPLIKIEVYGQILLAWAKTIGREHFNDPYAALMLIKIQLANDEYESALTQALRSFEKFPNFAGHLVDLLTSVKPPEELKASYTQLLTDLYIKEGDLETSIEQLQRMLEKEPKNIDSVIKDLRKLEVVNPQNLAILYTLADAYLSVKRISLAISELDKIIEIDENQYEEVLKRYKKAYDYKPNDPFVIQSLVNLYLKKDEIDAAVETIESVYKLDPGLLNEYILNLNTILEKDFDNRKALYLLGQCYARKGDKESALLIFDNLLEKKEFEYVNKAATEINEKNPDDLEYLRLRAISLTMLGEAKGALKLLVGYIKREPEKMVNLFPVFDLIIDKNPETFSVIVPFYKKYKKENPFIAELALARAYAFVREYKKSVNSFEQCFKNEEQQDVVRRALIEVIKERPDAVPLLLTAARAFIRAGEVEIATQFFKTAQMIDPQAFFEIINEFYDAIKAFPKDREARTLLVETFFNRGLWDKAIEESKRAIEVFDKDVQYFNLKLGQALVENGRLSEAVRPLMLSLEGVEEYANEVIEYLDKILKTDKSNVPAHFARGRALSKAGRLDEAVDEYLITAKILPARAGHILEELKILLSTAMANPKILFALGTVEMELKQNDDAVKHLVQACELEPTYVKRVIPLFEKLLEKKATPQINFYLAKVYDLADLTSLAIKFFVKAQAQDKAYREPVISEMKRICAENPKDIECRKGLADIFFNYNNYEDALGLVSEIYEMNNKETKWAKNFVARIMQLNPRHVPSYYFLARIFMDEGKQKKSIEVYRKLKEIEPIELTNIINELKIIEEPSGEILFYLGTLFKDIGEMSEAVNLFDRLFSTDPAFAEMIQNQLAEILEKNTNFGDAHLLISRIYAYQKEYQKAIDAVTRARELISENDEIVLKEGQLYYEAGEPEKAIKIYSELLNKTKNRNAIYRLIKKTRDDYFKERISLLKGDNEEKRLERTNIYLLMNKIKEAEKELDFKPRDELYKQHTLLKAHVYLRKNRLIDALEIMRNLTIDEETGQVYADIYEAMGSYGMAAGVLRQAGIEGMEQKIANFEKLAQERRSTKGKYFVEGRS